VELHAHLYCNVLTTRLIHHQPYKHSSSQPVPDDTSVIAVTQQQLHQAHDYNAATSHQPNIQHVLAASTLTS
jgi:hypothetical protein